MQQQKTRVILGGALGRKFGRIWDLYVDSPLEALRLLSSQIPGIREMLSQHAKDGVQYAMRVDGVDRSLETMGPGRKMLIMPVMGAAKSQGFFGILLGAGLIAASFMTPGSIFTAKILEGMFMAGVAMSMSGVISMLSPQPKLSSGNDSTTLESFYFNGGVNTVEQGAAVPIVYGRMRIGSVVVNASMVAR